MFDNATDRARVEIRKLRAAHGEITTSADAARSELTSLKRSMGETELDAILEGVNVAPRTRVIELEITIQAKDAALKVLLGRLTDAGRVLNRAKAEEIRKQAGELERELGKHSEKRQKLLGQLQELEGIAFAPAVDTENVGTIGTRSISLGPRRMQVSRSAILTGQIAALHDQARQIEASEPRINGQIDGASVEELIEAAGKVELFAPSEDVIRRWLEQASAQAERDWERKMAEELPGRAHPAHSVTYRLTWDSTGRIDASQSRAENVMCFDLGPRAA